MAKLHGPYCPFGDFLDAVRVGILRLGWWNSSLIGGGMGETPIKQKRHE
jgi:hypothetical protein